MSRRINRNNKSGFGANILIVVGGLLVVILVVMVVVVARRNLGTEQLATSVVEGNNNENIVEGQNSEVDDSVPKEYPRGEPVIREGAPTSICGDKICGEGENPNNCFLDCVDKEFYKGISFSKLGDAFQVVWSTEVPMTSEARLGSEVGSYNIATYTDNEFKTIHVAIFEGLDDEMEYFLKLSGKDETGSLHEIEGYQGIFE